MPRCIVVAAIVLLLTTAICYTRSLKAHRFHQPPDSVCAGESIYQLSKFEPSDLDFDDQTDTLYVVSDNGKLAALDVNGTIRHQWRVQKKLDLEGVTLIPTRHDVVYLGVEYPAEIVEFHLSQGIITRRWLIQDVYDRYPPPSFSTNAGLESLVYIPCDHGYLYAGRQADTRVFMFDIPSANTNSLAFRGTFVPPGPAIDLSAMTVYKNTLFFLYDKPRQLVGVDLSDPKWRPTGNEAVNVDAKRDLGKGHLHMHRDGMEGLVINGKHAFIAIDTKAEKDLLKFTLSAFWYCFSNDGDVKVLADR
ncbi:hypothetical protein SeMB42_g06127 [Synchytrium endobioticum]|uniref:Phytase-like domain-containing protein n=1 Tax=Synchytrium endobioticum TaxID=286115 RepID=A0A507CH68_9FUNG|nr:hypothetical protein SeLEV6574_g07544 [Synchytrium endobioticum]TPX40150.1 hypothetical protein SeMB42_g06127 [Synchytrium endobioticum]